MKKETATKGALALMAAALLAGCSSTPPPKPEPPPMLPSVISGMNVPPEDKENVRYDEGVKQYRSGRYIDPNNTKIMYERNNVYKIEEDAVWNLRPNAESTYRPAPWSPDKQRRLLDSQKPLIAEMETQFQEMKKATAESTKAIDEANKAKATAAETKTMMQNHAFSLTVMGKSVKDTSANIDAMQKRIDDLNKKIAEMEAARNAAHPTQTANPPDALKLEDFDSPKTDNSSLKMKSK